MNFTTVKVAGADAIAMLNDRREQYRTTRQYPFLIGGEEAGVAASRRNEARQTDLPAERSTKEY